MSTSDTTKPIKLFISHAWEDKEDFVRPLVVALRDAGFAVWYDEYALKMGDTLLTEIDKGLRECDFGVVVFSKHFFEKHWTESELVGLFARESKGRKLILPIWKDVTKDDVIEYSPILAGRLGVLASKGIESIVGEIQRSVLPATIAASLQTPEDAVEDFASLDRELTGAKDARELEESAEGVLIVQAAARQVISTLRERVEAMKESSKTLLIRIKKDNLDGPDTMTIVGGYAANIVIHYGNNYVTSISSAFIGFNARQEPNESSFKRLVFEPRFHNGGDLRWHLTDSDESFTSEQLTAAILKEIVSAFRELHEKQLKRQSR